MRMILPARRRVLREVVGSPWRPPSPGRKRRLSGPKRMFPPFWLRSAGRPQSRAACRVSSTTSRGAGFSLEVRVAEIQPSPSARGQPENPAPPGGHVAADVDHRRQPARRPPHHPATPQLDVGPFGPCRTSWRSARPAATSSFLTTRRRATAARWSSSWYGRGGLALAGSVLARPRHRASSSWAGARPAATSRHQPHPRGLHRSGPDHALLHDRYAGAVVVKITPARGRGARRRRRLWSTATTLARGTVEPHRSRARHHQATVV